MTNPAPRPLRAVRGLTLLLTVAAPVLLSAAPAWSQVKASMPGPRSATRFVTTPGARPGGLITTGGSLHNRVSTRLPPSPLLFTPRSVITNAVSPTSVSSNTQQTPSYAGLSAGSGRQPVRNLVRPPAIEAVNGISVDASASGGNWNVDLHLGSAYPCSSGYTWNGSTWCPAGSTHQAKPCYPYVWSNPWYWGYGWNWRTYNRYPDVIVYGPWEATDPYVTTGQTAQQQAAATAATLPKPPSLAETADAALRSGRAAEAVGLYRAHLAQTPDDAVAMRSLALALFDERRFDEAAAMMTMAYERAPRLAIFPVTHRQLSGGVLRLRERLGDAVRHAHTRKSASAWLAAAVFAQGEGSHPVARTLIGRASKAGLAREVADEFLLNVRAGG